MNNTQWQKSEAIEKLRTWLKPGDTVYTILRNASRSGMQREIGIVVMVDGTDLHPNYLVAKALGLRQDKRGGVIMSGCGMDMGFEIVYQLGSVLWPDGFECVGDTLCHSNDHFNGDRNYRPHHHRDGGYALKQRWL